MNRNSGSLVLLTTLLYTGCASSSPGAGASLPSPAPLPETIPEASTRPIHTGTLWKITPTPQTQAYSTLLTTVVVEADGLTTRRDSLTTRASYSISMTRGADSLSYSGSVTSFSIQGLAPEISEVLPTFPILFTGRINNHNIDIQRFDTQPISSDACHDTYQASLRIVQRNLFLLPLEIVDGQTWTDSTSSIVCNGILPLNHTSIRTFHVIGESVVNDSPALIIDQKEKTFSKGEGSQGQHQIFIDTKGQTSGHLYFDRYSGQLIAANLTNTTSLSVQSSGRIQHFSQTSTEITQKTR